MADTHNRVGSLPVGPVRVFSPHWAPLVIAVGYYLGARLGFALTLSPIPVSILWPPNAILLAGLVLTSIRVWPLVLTAVLGAHLLVQLQSGVPTVMVLSWFVSNCTEAVLGASLLKRFGGGSSTFDTFRGAGIFAGCAGFAAPFFSSFLDAAFVAANGWGDAGYWTVWRTRVFANTLASITVVPVILTVADAAPNRKRIPLRKCLEGALGAGALALVCWVVFGLHRPGPGTSPALLYAPLPVLVAAAVRFGPLGVSVSMLICTFIAIWGAAHGKGPFVSSAPADNALAIQLFLIVAWLPVMLLAAVIRERASANEKARWSDEQLAIAIDTAQLGRWEWDFAAERLTWSDTTRRIYEVPPGVPVTPRTFETLIHPDDRAIVAAASANALASRGIDVEFRVLFPDNRIKWIHSKGTTLFDADGQPVRIVGVKVDVTARKAVERHIHEQQRNLADLSRVSVAGEMSVALAHELNQPLAAILANAAAARRFLVRDPPELQELADIVEAIASDNQRAAAVITRFIAHSRRADERRSLLDVNFLAASVIDLARNDIISRGVSLVTRFDRGLPSVLGDVVQLQQVLLNLVVNACDAMEDAACDTRRLTVTTGSDGQGGVRVTVGDSGPGIAGERMEQIFEPFVTTKPHRLGLGLAICRSIVSTHDGQLDVDSQPGCGATFSMSLPAIPAGISGPRSKVGPWETDMESSSALGKVRDAD